MDSQYIILEVPSGERRVFVVEIRGGSASGTMLGSVQLQYDRWVSLLFFFFFFFPFFFSSRLQATNRSGRAVSNMLLGFA
jgi:hypothetical protein